MENYFVKKNSDMYVKEGEIGILINEESPQAYNLNAFACLIWESIGDGKNLKQIIESLSGEYDDVSEQQLYQDIKEFIQDLADNDLVVLEFQEEGIEK